MRASRVRHLPTRSSRPRWGRQRSSENPGSSRRSLPDWQSASLVRSGAPTRSSPWRPPDAELDAFVQEIRSGEPGSDQRPAAPTKFEDWEARVRRQNDVWCLVYGLEWRRVRNHALELLTEWHQAEPHKWPLSVVSDILEELHVGASSRS